jgi:hypothetical protein
MVVNVAIVEDDFKALEAGAVAKLKGLGGSPKPP